MSGSNTGLNNLSEKTTGHLKKIAKNAGITAGGNLFTMVTGPLTAVITTRALGPELYGIYSLATYWTNLLADISRLGFGGTLLRFTASYKGEGRVDKIKGAFMFALKISLLVGGALTLGMLVFAEPFCRLVINRPDVAPAFRFFSFNILLTAMYGVLLAALTGFQEQRYVVLTRSVISSLVKITTLILLLFLGLKLYAALASSLLQDLVILGLGYFFLIKVFPALKEKSIKPVTEKKELWKFSGTLFTTSIFTKNARQLDLLFLGMFRSLEEVGLYTVALRLQPLIYMPHYTIMQIFGPLVADLHSRGEVQEMKSLYKTVTKWTVSFSLPIFLTIVIFHEPILSIFGKEFRDAALAVLILGIGNAFADTFGMSGQIITMIGKPGINLVNSVVVALLSVIMYLVLIPYHGIVGAAGTYTFSMILINLIRVIQVYLILRIHPFKKSIWKTFTSASIALVFLWLLRQDGYYVQNGGLWIVELLFLWSAYVFSTWMMKLDAEDTMILRALKNKIVS
jgi:O-antigen/teichoic acid export membrane protein